MTAKSRSARRVSPLAADRERLAKISGLLGSSHDGEVVAAARKAEALRRTSGLTWAQLLNGDAKRLAVATEAAALLRHENEQLRDELTRLKAAIQRPLVPRPWADADSWQDGSLACLLWTEHLTDWEAGFLRSLLRRRKSLTKRQIEVLERVGEKVDRAIRVAWRYRQGLAA
jgi:hypothetical protein